MKKRYLIAPGPTPVPIEVLSEGIIDIPHHRSEEFVQFAGEVFEKLKYLFQTKNKVFTFASSGTGAMESAVSNLLSPGDKAIVLVSGKFGERWNEICQAFNVETVVLESEWGDTVPLERIEKAIDENPDAKVLLTTHSETSTGTVMDLKAIGEMTKDKDIVLVTDAISSLLAQELRMDEWNIDVVVSASQKGVMLPPGLGFIAMNEKAWNLVENSSSPRYYFDLRTYAKKYPESPYTPAINLIFQLKKAVEMIEEEGIEKIWERHRILADAVRAGVRSLKLELLSKKPGNVCTAVKVPNGVDGLEFVRRLRRKYGVTVAGGQGKLKGKIFRIAHLGYMGSFDVIIALSSVEMCLKEMGYDVDLGVSVKTAEEIFLKEGVV